MDKKQILIGAAVLLGVYLIYKKMNKPTEKGEVKGTSTTTKTTETETVGVSSSPITTPLSSGSNVSVPVNAPASTPVISAARMAAPSADTTGGDVTQNVRSGSRATTTFASQPLIATVSPAVKLQTFAANGWPNQQ